MPTYAVSSEPETPGYRLVATRTYACHLRRRLYQSVERSVRSVHLEVGLRKQPWRSLRCCCEVVMSLDLSSRRLCRVFSVCVRVLFLTEIRLLRGVRLCCSCHLLLLRLIPGLVSYLRHGARHRWRCYRLSCERPCDAWLRERLGRWRFPPS
jgi:hypothetical protein